MELQLTWRVVVQPENDAWPVRRPLRRQHTSVQVRPQTDCPSGADRKQSKGCSSTGRMACKRTRGAPRLKQSWTYLRSTQHGASGNHEACFGMRAGGEDRSADGPSTAWPRLRAKEDSSRVGVDPDGAEQIGKPTECAVRAK